ncbi:MAG: ABC transporter permease [Defluviitaleaceae bacterium]|nr:ABC transporter permease [Defluviitaleaceae bacterium]
MPNLKAFLSRIPRPTLILGICWIFILFFGFIYDLSLTSLLSSAIQRFGMWGLFVLAMVPTIKAGIGLNFALPVGVCAGHLAMVIPMYLDLTGVSWLLASVGFAVVFGVIVGYILGKLMNAVKGFETIVGMFAGFAATFAFSMFWLASSLPQRLSNIGWGVIGRRNFISLAPYEADRITDNFLKFEILRSTNEYGEPIGGLVIPTGTLLIVFSACLLMWLFFRSKLGIAISTAGMNSETSKASDINVDRSRILASIISTTTVSIGIIIYAQSFGFLHLYEAPLMMAFPAVAAILIGGASKNNAKIIHVIAGTFILQGIFSNAPPLLGRILDGADITDAIRMLIQNGIILYALIRYCNRHEEAAKVGEST